MVKKQRVLLTGMGGFIGSAISKALYDSGYDVWGIGQSPNENSQFIQVDLSSESDTIRAKKLLPDCSILVHTAAIAHGQKNQSGNSLVEMNVLMIDNIIKVFGNSISHFIFMSSVAVYGEDKRDRPVDISDILRPSTEYGISKVIGEEHLLKAKFDRCSILRLSPVFDEAHMNDIRKRVFLPILSKVKIKIIPSPQYSLSSVNTVIKASLSLLSNNLSGYNIYNISDSKTYSQNEITEWFSGVRVILPVFLVKPFYWLTYLLPKKYAYRMRCFYWKFFKSNIYSMSYTA
jgi:nucleoside-diphosphate-sugar epimerase